MKKHYQKDNQSIQVHIMLVRYAFNFNTQETLVNYIFGDMIFLFAKFVK